MTEQEQARSGGQALKKLRELYRLDLRAAQRKTGNKVSEQQISHLELGDRKRPSMRDLALLATAYGVTPNQLAESFGYWQPSGQEDEEPDDPRIVMLEQTVKMLPPRYRERLLNNVETITAIWKTEWEKEEILKRAKERNKEE